MLSLIKKANKFLGYLGFSQLEVAERGSHDDRVMIITVFPEYREKRLMVIWIIIAQIFYSFSDRRYTQFLYQFMHLKKIV